jgi:hypothetical protein
VVGCRCKAASHQHERRLPAQLREPLEAGRAGQAAKHAVMPPQAPLLGGALT